MRKGIITLAVLLTTIAVTAAEINLTEISEQVDFFGAQGGVVKSDNNSLVLFSFVGGGFLMVAIIIVFVGVIFYRYKYSSKEGGAVKEQDLFNKYNY